MSAHAMSPADAAWLHMDRRTNLMVINSVLWFDRPLDWEAVKRLHVERLVTPHPRFRQRVTEGLPGQPPAWVDDEELDVDLHFHRRALPSPGDRAALQELVSDLVATPLDRERPLWDLYLIEGYGDGCALLSRIHHAIADGIALSRVLLSLTDAAPDPGIAPAPAARGAAARLLSPVGSALAAGRAVAHESLDAAVHPEKLLGLAGTLADDGRTLAKLLLPGGDPHSALKGEQGIAHRVAWSDPVPLATVKEAGRATQTTVNDVLVAAVAGAVGEHLRASGDEVGEVHAMVPFNLRPLDRPLPRSLGNAFGLILLALPVGEADPLARLQAVHREMAAIKRSHEGALSYGILGALGRLPQRVERLLVEFFTAKGTMVLTNVPGPREPVALAGVPLRGVLVWAPCSGSVGMSVSVFSYAGAVTVGFLVDAALVEDPQPLADAVRDEVLRLAGAAAATAN